MKPSTTYLTLYTSVFLLGLNGLFSNGLPLDATTLTQVRSVFAGITLLAFVSLTKGTVRLPNKRSALIIYGLGILLGLHWISYFYAMQTASVAIGMLSLYTYPIMTVFIEPFFTKNKINRLDIFLVFAVLIGLIIIVSEHIGNTQNGVLIGALSGIASAIFFAFRNTLQKYYCDDVSSDKLMLHQMILVSLILALFADLTALNALSFNSWTYVIILGVLTTAIAHTLLIKSYKLLEAKTVAMISCLQPVIGSLAAWLILNESLHLTTIIGGGIILTVAIYESTRTSN